MTQTPSNPDEKNSTTVVSAAGASVAPATAAELATANVLKRRSLLGIFSLIFSALLVILCLTLGWASWTQHGTRTILNWLQNASGGELQLSDVRGRLSDHVTIGELSYQTKTLHLKASGIQLDWHPLSLANGKLSISSLQIAALTIASLESKSSPQLPGDLDVVIEVALQQAAIGRLTIATLYADGHTTPVTTMTGLTGQLISNQKQHQLQAKVTTDFGIVQAQATVAVHRPFVVQGQFDYQGQIDQHIPRMGITGSLTGSLQELVLNANAKVSDELAGEKPIDSTQVTSASELPKLSKVSKLSGELKAVLAPFSAEILHSLQATIDGLDPAEFAAQAPHAQLKVAANLKPDTKLGPNGLAGTIKLSNAQPGTIDKNGIPVSAMTSALRWSGDRLELSQTLLQLMGKGKISGAAQIQFTTSAFPIVDTRLEVSEVDLSQIDTRIRPTQIKGTIQAQTRAQKDGDHQITFQAQLHDPRASLNVDASYQPGSSGQTEAKDKTTAQTKTQTISKITLAKLELLAADSRLQGQGEIILSGTVQPFNFKGVIQNFDPSRWIAAPTGKISADFLVAGQLQPKLDVSVQLPSLQGQYAGQALSGAIDARWQQDAALTLHKLDVHWGKNGVTGSGAWGSDKGQLQLAIDIQELDALSHLIPTTQDVPHLGGSLKANLVLQGKMSEPAGKLDLIGQNLNYSQQSGQQIGIDSLTAKLDLARGSQGMFDGNIIAQTVRSNLMKADATDTTYTYGSATNPGTNPGANPASGKETSRGANAAPTTVANKPNDKSLPVLAEQISLSINGTRESHNIALNSRFNNRRSVSMTAAGGLNAIGKTTKIVSNKFAGSASQAVVAAPVNSVAQWQGQLLSFVLSGKPDVKLLAPMSVVASSQSLRLGPAEFSGVVGKLVLKQLEWSPDGLKTQGQWNAMNVIAVANLLKPQYAVDGDLLLNAVWDLQLKDHLQGEISLQRQSGDVRINDADGTGKAIPLGIRDLQMKMLFGGLVVGSDAEKMAFTMTADGARLGTWQARVNSALSKKTGTWAIAPDAPLEGQIKANIPDVQWLGPWINPGLALKGQLQVDAQLAGQFSQPRYQAKISGSGLEVAFAAEGLLLPNGRLEAVIDENRVRLNSLEFSNVVSVMPRHSKFQDVNWVGQKGELKASGDIDIRNQTGNIQAQLNQFPLLQRNDRWLVASGDLGVANIKDVWNVTGKIRADGAYFKLPKLPPPSLSSDVVVIRSKDKAAQNKAADDANKKALKSRLDMSFDMGSRFVFVGRGLDTALAGTIRLRSSDGNPVQASGSISTVGGAYEGYGQQLAIERGILNFQGPPANPGLNIRALRLGLAVEAGVEVVGTVAAPQVRLVSEPTVPDAEKLSWLVLGRGSDQIAGIDASLLMSAASAIFGGDGSRNVPRDIVQGLGFDEFSLGTADTSNGSKLPSQTVAGTTSTSGATSGDQVVSVGKRLAPGMVLSVERGLSDASGAIKLSWQLTRRVSIIGRTGTDSSIDAYYTFSFN
ncbi:translocation/assembly module TamB domain-containing protein [Undibacterium sp. RTI2.1]|uniref:translocation/assembly module TamB domain-containing protein n=1 Tax=unclassified Undibacterium TaxID=2630295 RepID=UPI002B228EDE|nr:MULTISPECIES: translocation/assembly module TamB domain-containing protein [unclassified Undibacterium]MEB0030858.1 translocation/assembly module TamB domain-containing protein [Undibacterium sp. RTI2.1]MEB0117299.1 translocation/assembly module TamB domain-containing protein [Undibacterium sp. RTI2.2]